MSRVTGRNGMIYAGAGVHGHGGVAYTVAGVPWDPRAVSPARLVFTSPDGWELRYVINELYCRASHAALLFDARNEHGGMSWHWGTSRGCASGDDYVVVSGLEISEEEAMRIYGGEDMLAVLLPRFTVRRLTEEEMWAQ